MELYYPVKDPINQKNLFGANPTQYKPLGQDGHPGLDLESPSGTPLYAPCDGDAFYVTDKYGGDGIWIRVPNNGAPAYNIILWHLFPKGDPEHPFKIPTDGSIVPVKAGDLLGYTDNSGAPVESTGPHLHLGVMPCDQTGEALHPNNGFLGCIDPEIYFNGKFAEDINIKKQIVQAVSQGVADVSQAHGVSNYVKENILQKFFEVLEEIL
jgi:murein DD-endopeptidase MepM/ murein hydrolase activator NlpD